jgi:S-adenosyl methyltransferase
VPSKGDWRDVFRPDLPSPARVYDYLLSGKDHFPADRVVAENLLKAMPDAKTAAMQNRAFLGRAVKYLAREAGIWQYLDIGTGLPNKGQVHEIAQAIAPQSRIAYVDNDPVVLSHSQNMLHAVDNTAIIRQDLRFPEDILGDEQVGQLLDLRQPVAVLLVAVLHFIDEADDPRDLVRRLMEPMPSGSHLVVSHLTADDDDHLEDAFATNYKTTSAANTRTHAEIEAFFTGLELVDPGVVWLPQWRPTPGTGLRDTPGRSLCFAGVARKP